MNYHENQGYNAKEGQVVMDQTVEQDLRVQEARQRRQQLQESLMEETDPVHAEYPIEDTPLSNSINMDNLSDAEHAAAVAAAANVEREDWQEHQQEELQELEIDESAPEEEYYESQSIEYEGHIEQEIMEEEPQQQHTEVAEFEPAPFVPQPIEILPQLDITGELRFVKERRTILSEEGRPHGDDEWAALYELERTTESLVASRRVVSEKQRQYSLLDPSDTQRSMAMYAEVLQLTAESKQRQNQWSAIKEAYHRDFVIAQAQAALRAASIEQDIRVLRTQIASLQKQLDAVSLRRKQMLTDADEQHRMRRSRN
ncbi:hypothetical protein BGZ83_011881 [Gryganskiella cystojenkinii]|nr:hypothetical protein BGZ83_011881 [Gryganskiella cystojenkinii]